MGAFRVLSLIAEERGSLVRSTVITEPRHLTELGQHGFDLGVQSSRFRQLTEMKGRPTPDEVRAFVAHAGQVFAESEPTRTGYRVDGLILVVGHTPACVTRLERLTHIARGTADNTEFRATVEAEPEAEALAELVALASVNPRGTFASCDVQHIPEAVLGHVVQTTATTLTQGDLERAERLTARIRRKLLEGGASRQAFSVDELIEEFERDDLLPPQVPWAGPVGFIQHDAVAVLSLCPLPVPADLLADALGTSVDELADALADPLAAGRVAEGAGAWWAPRAEELIRERRGSSIVVDLLRRYMRKAELTSDSAALLEDAYNVAALAARASEADPELVAQTFHPLDKATKATGDLSLVWRLSSLTLQAAQVVISRGRAPEEVLAAQALAKICGTSWVLQRTGQLDAALAELHHARRLNMTVADEVNTAFISKCGARINRLIAEELPEGDPEWSRELEASRRELETAYDLFSGLVAATPRLAEEPGDCLSLWARTEFVAGRRDECDQLRQRAHIELDHQPHTKSFADLVLLDAQVALADTAIEPDANRVATTARGVVETLEDVLGRQAPGLDAPFDAPRSEIAARAHEMCGQALVLLDQPTEATRHLQEAGRIYDRLPAAHRAYKVHDRVLDLNPAWIPIGIERALGESEPEPGVRHEAVRLHEERQRDAAGHEKDPDPRSTYWKTVLMEAQRRVASRHASWRETADRAG